MSELSYCYTLYLDYLCFNINCQVGVDNMVILVHAVKHAIIGTVIAGTNKLCTG
uniref:Uncharacterized protein n=1 Tax=Rhizophora mucronata TaxID=61149 RepID=A0A2P2PRI6_RHIMU